MFAVQRHGSKKVIAVLTLTALAYGIMTFGQSQSQRSRPSRSQNKEGARPTASIIGAVSCRGCHEHPEMFRDERLICKMDEYPVWKTKDRHQIAYEILFTPRSQEMGRRLGINVTDNESACVNCHGIVVPRGVEPFQFVAGDEGVTCVACHGAYQEWIAEHQTPNAAWRKLTRAEKQDLKGMRDLWDPKTRVETCLSCHVGDNQQGKILTHAMYAAGHPPLPSIETATFSDQQPRHWRYLREKTPAIQKLLGFNPNRLEQTELVAVGGIAVLGASMRLFAVQAKEGGAVAQKPVTWPDYARFDCLACHHELRSVNWSSARGLASACPPMPNWPMVLVPLGIEVAYPDAKRKEERAREFRTRVEALTNALRSRPYGDPEQAVRAARDLVAWSVLVKEDLERSAVDRRTALLLLDVLCRISQANTLDYDSARQVFWAFRAIYEESKAIDPKSIPDPDIPKILNTLEKRIIVSLPLASERKPIMDTLPERLRAIADYEPRVFRAYFAELAKRLPAR